MGQSCTVLEVPGGPDLCNNIVQEDFSGGFDEEVAVGDEEVEPFGAEGHSLLHGGDFLGAATSSGRPIAPLPQLGEARAPGHARYFPRHQADGSAGGEPEGEPGDEVVNTMPGEEQEEPEGVAVHDEDAEQRTLVQLEGGATYLGQWKGTVRHGFGRQRWPDGACFEGQWVEGLSQGRGSFLHSDGCCYVGEWQSGHAQGLGTFYRSCGSRYVGEWRDDLPEGVGVEAWSTGYRFEGEFRGGLRQGPGVYRLPDGSALLGCWEGPRTGGLGELRRGPASVFRGRWRSSGSGPAVVDGPGTYAWEDGQTYQGQFSGGQLSGFGSHEWPDGRNYEGFWREGRPHGWGWYKSSGDGIFKLSFWRRGRLMQDAPTASALKPKFKQRVAIDACSSAVICDAFPR